MGGKNKYQINKFSILAMMTINALDDVTCNERHLNSSSKNPSGTRKSNKKFVLKLLYENVLFSASIRGFSKIETVYV